MTVEITTEQIGLEGGEPGNPPTTKPPKSELALKYEHFRRSSEVTNGFASTRGKGFYIDPFESFDKLPEGALFYLTNENRPGMGITLRIKTSEQVIQSPDNQ